MILAHTSAWVEYDRATASPVDVRLTDLIADDGPWRSPIPSSWRSCPEPGRTAEKPTSVGCFCASTFFVSMSLPTFTGRPASIAGAPGPTSRRGASSTA